MWLCNNVNPLLDAGVELRSSPSRDFPQPTHDPWWKTDPRQIKVRPGHEAWRRDEDIGGVGELLVLLDCEQQW